MGEPMERRNEQRSLCEMDALVLMYGCHFQASISDWSQTGLRLVLSDGLRLDEAEAFILHGNAFGVLHGEVIWSEDGQIGARIRNARSAAVMQRLAPQLTTLMPA